MRAILRNYRQSPRKVRTVATYLKGKPVDVVMAELNILAKRSASPLGKLIASAVANAKQQGNSDTSVLFLKDIRVDGATSLRRARPRSRGMSNPIKKRTSHIYVELGVKEGAVKKEKKVAKTAKPKAKKTKE